MRSDRSVLVFLVLSIVVVGAAKAQPHIAAPRADESAVSVLVIDVDGDGVDLPASVTTDLIVGQAAAVRWTSADSTDSFLLLRNPLFDADSKADKQTAREWLLARADSPLRTNRKSGSHSAQRRSRPSPVEGRWFTLARLDRDGDGRLTDDDGALERLAAFRDGNANGTIDEGELSLLTDLGVVAVVIPAGDADAAAALEREDGTLVPLNFVEIGGGADGANDQRSSKR